MVQAVRNLRWQVVWPTVHMQVQMVVPVQRLVVLLAACMVLAG
jgi:hypothetical protein